MNGDYYTIKAISSSVRDGNVVLVLPTSAPELRQNVEEFARHFLREMHTDGIQFEASESPNDPWFVPYEAYLFRNGDRFIGAGCFRWREWQDIPPSWSFDWLWLHPHARRQGMLTAAWPQLVEKYGRFHLAQPISPAMQAFLKKLGWYET